MRVLELLQLHTPIFLLKMKMERTRILHEPLLRNTNERFTPNVLELASQMKKSIFGIIGALLPFPPTAHKTSTESTYATFLKVMVLLCGALRKECMSQRP